MEEYTRTDLALECDAENRAREERIGGFRVMRQIVREGGRGRSAPRSTGEYATVVCGKLWELEAEETRVLSQVLAAEIRRFAERMAGKRITPDFRVLVVGLGNPDITPDAVGPATVHRITVTRPLAVYQKKLFCALGCAEVSAFSPGVLGQTGLESADLLAGAVERIHPDLVLAVDALAARSCERLAATIQLADCGISPGSGIGNERRALNRENLGVPVLSVGVPTVVDSATLVYDALSRAGIKKDAISGELREVLENGRTFYVSPKESDRITKRVSELLASAIDDAFGTGNIDPSGGI